MEVNLVCMEQEGVKWSHEACKRQWRVLEPPEFGDVEQEPTPSPKPEDSDSFFYEDEQEPTPPVSTHTNYDDLQQISPSMMRHHSFPGHSFAPLPHGPYIFPAGLDRLEESVGKLKEEQIEVGLGIAFQ